EKLGDSVERATYRGKANEKEIKKLLRLEKDFALLKRIISMEGSREDINKLEARSSTPSHPTGQGLEAEAKTKQKAKTEEAFTSSLELRASSKVLSSSLELRASSKVLSSSLEPRASSQNIFINNFLSNLQRIAKDQNVEYELSDFGSIFEIAQKFYAKVLEREQIISDKLIKVFGEKKLNVGACLIGGFHTQGLKDRLTQAKIGYCVIAPHFDHRDDRSSYFRKMKDFNEFLAGNIRENFIEMMKRLGQTMVDSASLDDNHFDEWIRRAPIFLSIIQDLRMKSTPEGKLLGDPQLMDFVRRTRSLLLQGGLTEKLTRGFFKKSLGENNEDFVKFIEKKDSKDPPSLSKLLPATVGLHQQISDYEAGVTSTATGTGFAPNAAPDVRPASDNVAIAALVRSRRIFQIDIELSSDPFRQDHKIGLREVVQTSSGVELQEARANSHLARIINYLRNQIVFDTREIEERYQSNTSYTIPSMRVIEGDDETFGVRDSVIWIGEGLFNQIAEKELSLREFFSLDSWEVLDSEDVRQEIDRLRGRAHLERDMTPRLLAALENGEGVEGLIEEDKSKASVLLARVAMGQYEASPLQIERARFSGIPLLIEAMDSRILGVGLEPDDIERIRVNSHDFQDWTSERKLFFLRTLGPDCSRRSLEGETSLRIFLTDEDSQVRTEGLKVLEAYFTRSLNRTNRRMRMNHLYYFPSPQTVLLLLDGLEDSDPVVKERAINLLWLLVKNDPFYVIDALGLNFLSSAEQFKSNRMNSIVRLLAWDPSEIGVTNEAKVARLRAKARECAVLLLGEIVRWRDVHGSHLLPSEDIEKVADLFVEEILKKDDHFYQALSEYAKLQFPHRIEEVLTAIEEHFPQLSSIHQRARVVSFYGSMGTWDEVFEPMKARINQWLRPLIELGRAAEDEEIQEITLDEGTLVRKVDPDQDLFFKELSGTLNGIGEINLRQGMEVRIENGFINGQKFSKLSGPVNRDGKAEYSLRIGDSLGSGFSGSINIQMDVSGGPLKRGESPSWDTPLQGTIYSIRISSMKDLRAQDRVHVLRPSAVIIQSAVENFNFSLETDGIDLIRPFLSSLHPGLRRSAIGRLRTSFLEQYPEFRREVMDHVLELWRSETHPRVLTSLLYLITNWARWMEGEDREQAGKLLREMREEYRRRPKQDIHVMNELNSEVLLLEPDAKVYAKLSEEPMLKLAEEHAELLQEFIGHLKDYLRRYDTFIDTTEDEGVLGLSTCNIVKMNIGLRNLFGFVGTLKHEVRHRAVKLTNVSLKKNELSSRIEDALCVKVLERQRLSLTSPKDQQFIDFRIAQTRSSLGGFDNEIYGPLSDEMNLFLERILKVDVGREGWIEELNQILQEAEAVIGFFVPPVTENEVTWMDQVFLREEIDLIIASSLDPAMVPLFKTLAEVLKAHFNKFAPEMEPSESQRDQVLALQTMMINFTRMHIHLEEDLRNRLMEMVASEPARGAVSEVFQRTRTDDTAWSGAKLWDAASKELRSHSLTPEERGQLLVRPLGVFSEQLSRSDNGFREVSAHLLSNPRSQLSLITATMPGTYQLVEKIFEWVGFGLDEASDLLRKWGPKFAPVIEFFGLQLISEWLRDDIGIKAKIFKSVLIFTSSNFAFFLCSIIPGIGGYIYLALFIHAFIFAWLHRDGKRTLTDFVILFFADLAFNIPFISVIPGFSRNIFSGSGAFYWSMIFHFIWNGVIQCLESFFYHRGDEASYQRLMRLRAVMGDESSRVGQIQFLKENGLSKAFIPMTEELAQALLKYFKAGGASIAVMNGPPGFTDLVGVEGENLVFKVAGKREERSIVEIVQGKSLFGVPLEFVASSVLDRLVSQLQARLTAKSQKGLKKKKEEEKVLREEEERRRKKELRRESKDERITKVIDRIELLMDTDSFQEWYLKVEKLIEPSVNHLINTVLKRSLAFLRVLDVNFVKSTLRYGYRHRQTAVELDRWDSTVQEKPQLENGGRSGDFSSAETAHLLQILQIFDHLIDLNFEALKLISGGLQTTKIQIRKALDLTREMIVCLVKIETGDTSFHLASVDPRKGPSDLLFSRSVDPDVMNKMQAWFQTWDFLNQGIYEHILQSRYIHTVSQKVFRRWLMDLFDLPPGIISLQGLINDVHQRAIRAIGEEIDSSTYRHNFSFKYMKAFNMLNLTEGTPEYRQRMEDRILTLLDESMHAMGHLQSEIGGGDTGAVTLLVIRGNEFWLHIPIFQHSARMHVNLNPLAERGEIRLNYQEGDDDGGNLARIDLFRRILEGLGFKVSIRRASFEAVLTKEEASFSVEKMEHLTVLVLRMILQSYNLDVEIGKVYPVENEVGLNDALSRMAEVFREEESHRYYVGSDMDDFVQSTLFLSAYLNGIGSEMEFSGALRDKLNYQLACLGLAPIPNHAHMSQVVVDQYYNQPLLRAFKAGYVQMADFILLDPRSAKKMAARFAKRIVDQIDKDPKDAVEMGLFSRALDAYLEFYPVLLMGPYLVEQGLLKSLQGDEFVMIRLRDPQTNVVLSALAFRAVSIPKDGTIEWTSSKPVYLNSLHLGRMTEELKWSILKPEEVSHREIDAVLSSLTSRPPPVLLQDMTPMVVMARSILPSRWGQIVYRDQADQGGRDSILVVPFTTPSDLPLIKKVGSIVTTNPNELSHAAIVARELGTLSVAVQGEWREGRLYQIRYACPSKNHSTVIVRGKEVSVAWALSREEIPWETGDPLLLDENTGFYVHISQYSPQMSVLNQIGSLQPSETLIRGWLKNLLKNKKNEGFLLMLYLLDRSLDKTLWRLIGETLEKDLEEWGQISEWASIFMMQHRSQWLGRVFYELKTARSQEEFLLRWISFLQIRFYMDALVYAFIENPFPDGNESELVLLETLDRWMDLAVPASDGKIGLGEPRIEHAQSLDKDVLLSEDIQSSNRNVLGGKGFQLSELAHISVEGQILPTAPFFIVTANVFLKFLEEQLLGQTLARTLHLGKLSGRSLKGVLSEILGSEKYGKELSQRLALAREVIERTQWSDSEVSAQKILGAFDHVIGEGSLAAVRSSHENEDASMQSHAGLYRTELGVSQRDLLSNIQRVWASALNEEAFVYQGRNLILPETLLSHLQMGVVIQTMIAADASGVLFTQDPNQPEKPGALVRATYGLGVGVVGGEIPVDSYRLNLETGELSQTAQIAQKNQAFYLQSSGGVENRDVPISQRHTSSLTQQHLFQLARMARAIRNYFNQEMDIEFAVVGDKVFILQARPITSSVRSPLLGHQTFKDEKLLDTLPLSPWFELLERYPSFQILMSPLRKAVWKKAKHVQAESGTFFAIREGEIIVDEDWLNEISGQSPHESLAVVSQCLNLIIAYQVGSYLKDDEILRNVQASLMKKFILYEELRRGKGPLRVLCVCLGNSHRSPTIQYSLEHQKSIDPTLSSLEISSAGVSTGGSRDGSSLEEEIINIAHSIGLGSYFVQHRRQPVTNESIRDADLVIAADEGILQDLEKKYAAHPSKILLWGETTNALPAILSPDLVDPASVTDKMTLVMRMIDRHIKEGFIPDLKAILETRNGHFSGSKGLVMAGEPNEGMVSSFGSCFSESRRRTLEDVVRDSSYTVDHVLFELGQALEEYRMSYPKLYGKEMEQHQLQMLIEEVSGLIEKERGEEVRGIGRRLVIIQTCAEVGIPMEKLREMKEAAKNFDVHQTGVDFEEHTVREGDEGKSVTIDSGVLEAVDAQTLGLSAILFNRNAAEKTFTTMEFIENAIAYPAFVEKLRRMKKGFMDQVSGWLDKDNRPVYFPVSLKMLEDPDRALEVIRTKKILEQKYKNKVKFIFFDVIGKDRSLTLREEARKKYGLEEKDILDVSSGEGEVGERLIAAIKSFHERLYSGQSLDMTQQIFVIGHEEDWDLYGPYLRRPEIGVHAVYGDKNFEFEQLLMTVLYSMDRDDFLLAIRNIGISDGEAQALLDQNGRVVPPKGFKPVRNNFESIRQTLEVTANSM
ncbi:MAG: hypothetical protein HYZ66_01445, partial [Chlamydiae bacterium]|nr:hypothetical protein [Chlamydiota bacterium]